MHVEEGAYYLTKLGSVVGPIKKIAENMFWFEHWFLDGIWDFKGVCKNIPSKTAHVYGPLVKRVEKPLETEG